MNRKFLITIIFLVIIFNLNLSINLFSKNIKTINPKQITDIFFKKIIKNKVSEAYDFILQGSSIKKYKPKQVEILKKQTSSQLPLYGKIIGFEFLKQEKFGTSIVRLVYILKSEQAPTIWEFYFYKPKDKWLLGSLMFNDQFRNLR